MSHEDAVQALTEAVAQDAGEQAVESAPPAPAEAPAPVEGAPENVPAPAEVQAPAEGNTDEEFVPFNPDELPEELIPAWRQLQAAYTPRLQEAAAIRKQYEALGGQESVQQAVELAQWIQNPDNWPAVYEEMYNAMEQAGFEFEDGSPAPTAPAGAQFDPSDDPDLAPIIGQLRSLESQTANQQKQIEQFYAQQESQQQMAALELQQMQQLAEMQRQVGAIRQANPHYNDDDMRAVIELASFYNDDIPAAQQRYESIVASRLSRYIEGKRAAGAPSIQTPAGAGVTSHVVADDESLADVEESVVELMRNLQAQGEFDQ